MNAKLSLVAAAASVLALSACALESGEPDDELTMTQQAVDGKSNPLDSLLAALGSATLDCLGTTGKDTYKIVVPKSGSPYLARGFSQCPVAKDPKAALANIDALLAIQLTKVGQADGVGTHYATTWKKFQDNFPKIEECPTWKKIKVVNPPTWDSVKKAQGNPSDVNLQKENYEYAVASKSCGKDADCTVKTALACASGFGQDFLIKGAPEGPNGPTVLVDPIWWLTHYDFQSDSDNPFKTPGYYHGMSYYGAPPGSLYGAIEREGEACSKWTETNAKQYTDRKLVGLDCGGGWYCATYCQ